MQHSKIANRVDYLDLYVYGEGKRLDRKLK